MFMQMMLNGIKVVVLIFTIRRICRLFNANYHRNCVVCQFTTLRPALALQSQYDTIQTDAKLSSIHLFSLLVTTFLH